MSTRQRMAFGFLLVAGAVLAAAVCVLLLRHALVTGEFTSRSGHVHTWADDRLTYEFHLFKLGLGALIFGAGGVTLAWAVLGTPKVDREIERLARAKMERDEAPRTSTLFHKHARQLEGDRFAGRAQLLDRKIEVGGERVDDTLDEDLRR